MTTAVSIYGLRDPHTGKIRYVGKSKNPKRRYNEHTYMGRKGDTNYHLYHWIKKLRQDGLMPELVILETVPMSLWRDREIYWIAHLGRINLCNMNDGGFEPPDTTGRKATQEQRARLTEVKTGVPIWHNKPHPMLGKQHPCKGRQIHGLEYKEDMRQNRLGNKNPMFGTRITEAQRIARVERQSIAVDLVTSSGDVIQNFISAKAAGHALGLSQGSVTRVCKGEYRHTRGMIFRYAAQKSSKTCSACGSICDKMPLDVRSWTCVHCGAHHDRDINAAKNIRAEGLRILAGGTLAAASRGNVRPKPRRNPRSKAAPVEARSSVL